MIKSLISIAIALVAVFGITLTETTLVRSQFHQFETALAANTQKVEEERATEEDLNSLKTLWEEKKRVLYALIPHEDIARVDDYLAEAKIFVAKKDFPLALSKLEVLIQLCSAVPDAYRATPENVF
ncbi:MAG: DUF4363 family protein [Clostridia bacterium]|nr:DUF4363 family protein [Clostridia bacterium]